MHPPFPVTDRPTPSVNISPCKWMDSSVIWRRSGFGDPSPVSLLDCSPLAPFPGSLLWFGNPAHQRLVRAVRLVSSSVMSLSRYGIQRKINRSVRVIRREYRRVLMLSKCPFCILTLITIALFAAVLQYHSA